MDTILYKLLTHDQQARIYLIDNMNMIDEANSLFDKKAIDAFPTIFTFNCILHGLFSTAKRLSVKLETSDPSIYVSCGADIDGNVQGFASDVFYQYSNTDIMTGDSGCLKIVQDNGMGALFTGIVEISDSIRYHYI